MREDNGKHGHKGKGRNHGGNGSKKPGKRRMAQTNVPPPAAALLPKWFTDGIKAPSTPAPPVETPRLVASPIAEPQPPQGVSRETDAFREAVGAGPMMRRGQLAVLAFVMAVICGVALLRACKPKGTPIEDDAAEAGGVHERAILDADLHEDPVAFNTHVVVGLSATHRSPTPRAASSAGAWPSRGPRTGAGSARERSS